MKQTTVPPPFDADLAYLQPQDIPRLMASLVALGGEVILLKAEVQRLRLALQQNGSVAPEQVQAAGASEAFRAWFAAENAAFARTLLDPLGGPATGTANDA